MIMIRSCLICFLSGLCAFAAPAEAGAPPTPAATGASAQHPCADDLAHLCKTVPSGAGRKFACLDTHKAKLRPSCRTFIEALDARYVQMAAQRHESVSKFLADAYARYNTGVKVRPGKPTSSMSRQPQQ
jgi:hypothetical protein